MLVNALVHAARRSPRKPAVSDGARSLNYRQLALLASVLRDIASHETTCPRIGIMLPASTAFPGVLMGTLWASKVAIPLNFLLRSEELVAVIEDAELDLIITVRHFRSLVQSLPARALFLEELPLKRRMMRAVLRRHPPCPSADPLDTAVILYTSGTTGQPKGVELSYRNLRGNCTGTIASLGVHAEDRFLNILPPFHVFGLTATVLIPIELGATVHALPRFNPLAAIKAVAKNRVTLMLAIPSMYAAMLRTKSSTADDFRSVTLAMSGGEPLPDSIRIGFEERFGVVLQQGYGLTETSPVVTACTRTEHRVGTVGRAIRDVRVRIVDPDGKPMPPNQDGEILVAGPGVMKGYYRKPQETARVMDREGWFRTGDLGSLDEDGYLTISGRVKEMLIIGGENVFPREIEAVLEEHPEVLQAAVIGIPDGLRGEAAVAFVVPQRDAHVNESQLRAFVKRSLAGFKVPKRVEIREDLPTGPTGKILKRRLPELLETSRREN